MTTLGGDTTTLTMADVEAAVPVGDLDRAREVFSPDRNVFAIHDRPAALSSG